MSRLTVIPAYGRDYASKEEVLADWNADKDFESQNYGASGYINKSGAKEYGIVEVTIRYAKLRRLAKVEVK